MNHLWGDEHPFNYFWWSPAILTPTHKKWECDGSLGLVLKALLQRSREEGVRVAKDQSSMLCCFFCTFALSQLVVSKICYTMYNWIIMCYSMLQNTIKIKLCSYIFFLFSCLESQMELGRCRRYFSAHPSADRCWPKPRIQMTLCMAFPIFRHTKSLFLLCI